MKGESDEAMYCAASYALNGRCSSLEQRYLYTTSRHTCICVTVKRHCDSLEGIILSILSILPSLSTSGRLLGIPSTKPSTLHLSSTLFHWYSLPPQRAICAEEKDSSTLSCFLTWSSMSSNAPLRAQGRGRGRADQLHLLGHHLPSPQLVQMY